MGLSASSEFLSAHNEVNLGTHIDCKYFDFCKKANICTCGFSISFSTDLPIYSWISKNEMLREE